jgi:hypothetical protein
MASALLLWTVFDHHSTMRLPVLQLAAVAAAAVASAASQDMNHGCCPLWPSS